MAERKSVTLDHLQQRPQCRPLNTGGQEKPLNTLKLKKEIDIHKSCTMWRSEGHHCIFKIKVKLVICHFLSKIFKKIQKLKMYRSGGPMIAIIRNYR